MGLFSAISAEKYEHISHYIPASYYQSLALILEYPDHHQNLISSSLYYPGLLHKISSQSVYNFLSNVVHRQTDRQTDKQTNKQTVPKA